MHGAMTCNIGYTIAMYSTVFKSHFTDLPMQRSGERVRLGIQRSLGCWFEPPVYHYFSSSNVRLLAYPSLQVKTHNQNEWSVTNQIGYTGFRQDSYL